MDTEEFELPEPIAMGGYAFKGSGKFYLHEQRYSHTIDLYSREQVLELLNQQAKTRAKSTT